MFEARVGTVPGYLVIAAAVPVLWYFIGRWMDNRRLAHDPSPLSESSHWLGQSPAFSSLRRASGLLVRPFRPLQPKHNPRILAPIGAQPNPRHLHLRRKIPEHRLRARMEIQRRSN